jgi:hypothetical protein
VLALPNLPRLLLLQALLGLVVCGLAQQHPEDAQDSKLAIRWFAVVE